MQSILDAINEWIKEILIGAINGNLSTMFGDVNEKVGTIAAEVDVYKRQVLTHDSPVGWKGEKMRLFLTDTGYSKALENQEKGHIKIRNHAKVLSGDLHYDHKDRER